MLTHFPIMKSVKSVNQSRMAGLVSAVVVGVVLGASVLFEWWSWAGVPTMKPRFADLRMITSTADCIARGGWSIYSESCDPFGREYNYPPIWAQIFAALGLGEQSALKVGVVLGLMLVLLLVFLTILVSRAASNAHLLAVVMCSISPPTALLLERGNTDIVILLIIVLAAGTFRRVRVVSALLSGLAVGLKVFPGLVSLVFLRTRTALRDLGLLSIIAVLMLEPYLAVLRMASREPPYTRDYSFGASSSLAILFPDILDTRRSIYLIPLNVLVTCGLALAFVSWRKKSFFEASQELNSSPTTKALFQFASLTFVGVYLSGTKHDYSLAFLVVVSAAVGLTNSRAPLLLALQALNCVSMWTAFGWNGRSVISDLAVSMSVFIQLGLVFTPGLTRAEQTSRT